jgi:DNA polymerase V
MKAKKINEVKSKFAFEAPVYPAAVHTGNKNLVEKAEDNLDLHNMLAPRPERVYMVHVSGRSMINENIHDGDVLIVDRLQQPKEGDIVIASLNGELLVKTYRKVDGKVYLFSANEKFLPIEIFPFWNFEIQGVVKHIIRHV